MDGSLCMDDKLHSLTKNITIVSTAYRGDDTSHGKYDRLWCVQHTMVSTTDRGDETSPVEYNILW